MTRTKLNTAIAEACGIHGPWERKVTPCSCDGDWDLYNPNGVRLPDYVNDLNAMQTVQLILEDYPRSMFRVFLRGEVMEDPSNPDNAPEFATAGQRASAFLRTVGKWEEVQP